MLEVSYTTTRDDYVTFCRYVYKRWTPMKWAFVGGWVAVPLACLLWAALHKRGGSPTASEALFLGIAYAVIYPLCHRRWVGQNIRDYAQDNALSGGSEHITLRLTDAALTERIDGNETVIPWTIVKGMAVVGDCTYIFVTNRLAAIIPRHGFEREEDYKSVRDFALSKVAKIQ